MELPRPAFLERRGAAVVVFVLFVAVGLVFVFAGTLARATDLEAQAAVARADRDALAARVALGAEEIQFIKTDTFVEQHARAVGYGNADEIAVRLPEDAPSPAPIVPLGRPAPVVASEAPLDAWLDLLFGP